MGCVSSGVRVATKPKNPSTMFVNSLDGEEPIPQTIEELLLADVKAIISEGANTTPVPDPVASVVLVGDSTMPITIGIFRSGDNELLLPIAAISRGEKGRMALLGSTSFLEASFIENSHTFSLIESLLNWGTALSADSSRILVIGFPKSASDALQSAMQSSGYGFDVRESLPTMHTHNVVLIASDFYCDDLPAFIEEMQEMDRCVIVFAAPFTSDKAFRSNEYTRQYGLAFSVCGLVPLSSSLKIRDMSDLMGYSLETLKDDFLRVALRIDFQSEEERMMEMSEALTRLRYYIRELPIGSDPAYEIMKVSYDCLRKIGMEMDDKFCPRPLQRMLSYVLMETIEHVGPTLVPELPCLERFPGLYDNRDTGDFSMKLSLHSDTWNATGMWLPPGVKATVTVDTSVLVQIGSHTMPLEMDADEWRRWPIVTLTFRADVDAETQIATPVGGMIYFLSDKTKSVHVKFRGVIRYPFWHHGKVKVWEDTKESTIPWAEVSGNTVTFTIPTAVVKGIPDVGEFILFYEKLLSLMSRFVGVKKFPRTRIVFDPGVTSESVQMCDTNVIVVPLEWTSQVVDITTASEQMHRLLTCCCQSLISESFFDESIEFTISAVAASYAIATKLNDLSLMDRFQCGNVELYDDLKLITGNHGFVQIATAMTALMSNPTVTTSHTACSVFMMALAKHISSPLGGLLGYVRSMGTIAEDSSPKLSEFEVKESQL